MTGEQPIRAAQETLPLPAHLRADASRCLRPEVVEEDLSLQEAPLALAEDVSQDRLDQLGRILREDLHLFRGLELGHVRFPLENDDLVLAKLGGTAPHQLVEKDARRQVARHLARQLHEGRPARGLIGEGPRPSRSIRRLGIRAPAADQARRVIHAERARCSRALVRGANAANLLAVDAGHQRDPAIRLTAPGQGQFVLGDLDEKLTEASFDTAKRNPGRQQPLHQWTKYLGDRFDQAFANVGHPLDGVTRFLWW